MTFLSFTVEFHIRFPLTIFLVFWIAKILIVGGFQFAAHLIEDDDSSYTAENKRDVREAIRAFLLAVDYQLIARKESKGCIWVSVFPQLKLLRSRYSECYALGVFALASMTQLGDTYNNLVVDENEDEFLCNAHWPRHNLKAQDGRLATLADQLVMNAVRVGAKLVPRLSAIVKHKLLK